MFEQRVARSRYSIVAMLLASGAAICAMSQTALAQSEGGVPAAEDAASKRQADPTVADEIIVTARRREESLSDVPIAIAAFSNKTIEQRNIESTFDLIKVTPGFNINSSGIGNIYVTIRGQTRATAGLGTPGVISYFNDVPLPTIGSAIPAFDLDNIQVLKGPQGTLFGRNAIGGAVLNNSRKPDYNLGGYVEAEYGRFDHHKIEGALNLPIVRDVLALRVAGQYENSDGYQKTIQYLPYTQDAFGVSTPGTLVTGGKRYDASKVQAVRASLLFEPAPGISNVTVFDYNRFTGAPNNTLYSILPNGVPPGNQPSPIFIPAAFLLPSFQQAFGPVGGAIVANNIGRLFQCGAAPNCDIFGQFAAQQASGQRTSYTDLPTTALVRTIGVSNTTSLGISDSIGLKNIFAYRRTRWAQNQDNDGTALPILDTTGFSEIEQITEELQVSGKGLGDKLNYVIGGFYYATNPTGPQGAETLGINVFGGLQNSTATTYKHERSKALYGQFDYDLSALLEGVALTAGYRHTWDESSGCAYTVNYTPFGGEKPGRNDFLATEQQCKAGTIPLFPGAYALTSANFAQKSAKGTYTFAANWKVSPATLIYATTRKGYRTGSFNGTIVDPALAPLRTYAPETLTDYEAGIKTRWNAGGISGTIEADVFTGKDKGYQYYQQTPNIPPLPNGGLIINKADLRIRGFDVQGTVQPLPGLTLGGGASYTDIKILKLTLPPMVASSFTAVGVDPSPTTTSGQPKWQASAYATYSVPDVAGGTLLLHADFHYQSRFAQGEVFIPGYRVVDAKIGLEDVGGMPLDISLNVRNLFNAFYYDTGALTSFSLGALSNHVAPPRTWSLRVRYRFGS